MRAGARPGPQGGRDAMVPRPDQAGPGVLCCRVVRHSAGGARAVSTHGKYRADLVSRWPSSRRAHGPLVVGPDRAIRVSIGSVPREAHGPSVPRADAVAGPASWAFFTAGDPDNPGSHWPGSD